MYIGLSDCCCLLTCTCSPVPCSLPASPHSDMEASDADGNEDADVNSVEMPEGKRSVAC